MPADDSADLRPTCDVEALFRPWSPGSRRVLGTAPFIQCGDCYMMDMHWVPRASVAMAPVVAATRRRYSVLCQIDFLLEQPL
jgi:hypothetical protein